MAGTAKRGKYLGFVAHEIKNPLATALWSCDLLKRMEGPDRAGERADKMIDVSLRALRRIRRLVDDYFTIERLNEHGYELRRERLAVRDVVEGAARVLAEKEGVDTAAWTFKLADGAATRGDPDMLQRAVRLSLEHMARTSKAPHLTVVSVPDGAGAAVQIRSETPPSPVIPPDPEERPSGDPAGAVLGFALASRILEAHGGRIEERDGSLRLVFPAAD